ncbi:hypothetical protein BLA29_013267, partial [Euroglyphus maynei]
MSFESNVALMNNSIIDPKLQSIELAPMNTSIEPSQPNQNGGNSKESTHSNRKRKARRPAHRIPGQQNDPAMISGQSPQRLVENEHIQPPNDSDINVH